MLDRCSPCWSSCRCWSLSLGAVPHPHPLRSRHPGVGEQRLTPPGSTAHRPAGCRPSCGRPAVPSPAATAILIGPLQLLPGRLRRRHRSAALTADLLRAPRCSSCRCSPGCDRCLAQCWSPAWPSASSNDWSFATNVATINQTLARPVDVRRRTDRWSSSGISRERQRRRERMVARSLEVRARFPSDCDTIWWVRHINRHRLCVALFGALADHPTRS